MKREDFATLFMWGIQFDPHVGWLASEPKKADKGSYWTPAMLAFLDRLGTKLGFTVDMEIGVTGKKWVDMVWFSDEQLVFIEHESSWDKGKIEDAISRLEGMHSEKHREADARILISYSWPGEEIPTREKSAEVNELINDFVNKDKRNLAIVYPYDKWPRDEKGYIDLTLFQIRPPSADKVTGDESTLRLFQRP